MTTRLTQKDKILRALRRGKKVTRQFTEGVLKVPAENLSRRIAELRQAGFQITTSRKQTKGFSRPQAVYTLSERQQLRASAR